MNRISVGSPAMRMMLTALLLIAVFNRQAQGQSFPLSEDGSDWIRSIPVTRWVSPNDEKPLSYREWKVDHPDFPLITAVSEKWAAGDSTEVLLLVNWDLYDTLSVSLNQYVADMQLEGYAVEVISMAGGTPADLKLILQGKKVLKGAVLIGDLPVPWFQENYFGKQESEEFPVDLYYMDLDGEWLDQYAWDPVRQVFIPGPDGILDTHGGDVQPEIWVGRLTASPLNRSEVTLLEDYFSRAHRYREGSILVNSCALNYIDDDWSGSWTTAGLDSIYDVVKVVDHPESTVASDYAQELLASYEWIGVCAHSWPRGHVFYFQDGARHDVFDIYKLSGIDPQAIFYNLFACSNARYVEEMYMGGCYIFDGSYGLGAVGSTKTGSMLYFEQFYHPLGDGACLGEAFREWFSWIAQGGFTTGEIGWFYGMTLLGDPTLVPRRTTHYALGMIAEPRGGVYPSSGLREAGSVVKIRAAPGAGYEFSGWVGTGNGSYSGPLNPACVVVNGPISEIACFSPVVAVSPQDEKSSSMPQSFVLSQNFPNPFNGGTRVHYGLPRSSHIALRVYNVFGQPVRELINEDRVAGYHETSWDGKNSMGNDVASGIYFICLRAGHYQRTRKMMLLR